MKEVLNALPFDHLIQHKASASDLGFQLQYSGNVVKGASHPRLQKSEARLWRLKCMSLDLVVKEQVRRTSIPPAAFYGCVIRPPSQDEFDHFRSLAAQAILGHCQNVNPAVVLFFANGGVLDPEFWILP